MFQEFFSIMPRAPRVAAVRWCFRCCRVAMDFLRITEVNLHICGDRRRSCAGPSPTRGPRLTSAAAMRGACERAGLPKRGHDRRRVFAGHFDQHGKNANGVPPAWRWLTGCWLGASEQIALPMTGDGSVFDLGGSFANGNSIDDPALRVSKDTGVPRAAYSPLEAKMLNQLLFQRSPRLNEQVAINSFVETRAYSRR